MHHLSSPYALYIFSLQTCSQNPTTAKALFQTLDLAVNKLTFFSQKSNKTVSALHIASKFTDEHKQIANNFQIYFVVLVPYTDFPKRTG